MKAQLKRPIEEENNLNFLMHSKRVNMNFKLVPIFSPFFQGFFEVA
jgi:hypothetical protein